MSLKIPFQGVNINQFVTGWWTNRSPLNSMFGGQPRIDGLLDGLNVQVSAARTIKRRPGFPQYSTASMGAGAIIRNAHSFVDSNSAVRLFVDDSLAVAEVTPTGKSNIHTLTGTTDEVHFIDVGPTIYFNNSHDNNKKKYTGSATSNWGIATPATAPTLNAAENTVTFNITSLSRVNGVVTMTTTTNHTFAVGDQLVVWVDPAQDPDASWFITTARVASVPAADQVTYFHAADDESLTLSPTTDGLTGVAITSKFGYRYRYAYRNSATGHTGSASPASVNTGPFKFNGVLDEEGEIVGLGNVTVGGPRSTDAQVDKVQIYRTLDGGSSYFELAEIANPGAGDWTYVDVKPDVSLGLTKAAVFNENDPPPTGLRNMEFHAGRLWGSVNNIVHYAASASDVAAEGVAEESWDILNTFTFPHTVRALKSSPLGLLVFMDDSIGIVLGVNKESFRPDIFSHSLGVTSFHHVASEGGDIFFYTGDQIYLLRSTQLIPVGDPILDQIRNLSTVYMTVHRGGLHGGLYLAHSGTGTPVLRLELPGGTWSTPWRITDGTRFIGSLRTAATTRDLLAADDTANGKLLKLDPTASTDQGGNYTANVILGSLVLAPPGAMVEVESIAIDRASAGTAPTVAIVANDFAHLGLGGTVTNLTLVDEPPELPASTAMKSHRGYLRSAATPVSSLMRHCQVKITFPTEDAANEILSLSLAGPSSDLGARNSIR